MATLMPADYDRLVTEDLRSYEGLSDPVKAGLAERLFCRMQRLQNLHPNPDDEFCNPNIGPNFEIIGDYVRKMTDKRMRAKEQLQPLSVEKMSTGGYMLLDGHHRWFAAYRAGITALPVKIMNVTPVHQIISNVKASDRRMCVSFDLDEVLLTDGKQVPQDKAISLIMRMLVRNGLRMRAPSLIRELQKMGFDVWVYSSGYLSESALHRIFRFHGVHIDGIVNGFRKQEHRAQLRKAFMDKYVVSLHIDGSDIVWVNTRTREYDSVPIGGKQSEWGARTLMAVKNIDVVKQMI